MESAMLDNSKLLPAVEKLLEECDPDLVYTPDYFPLEVMEMLQP
jgi:hypothetical protein